MNVDGSGLRRLTNYDGFDGFPCFSPDGAKLVFISNRNGKDPRKDLNVFIADWR
jgi:Tol biopolymer transport system component